MENTKKQTALEQFIAELDHILDISPSEWDKINKAAARALKMENAHNNKLNNSVV
jgi:hypothetical protein